MIEKIDTSQIQDILGKSSSGQPDSAKAPSNIGADASLHLDCDSFIERAMQTTPQTDDEAVRQAQELLLSGELESQQNIRAAAENIVNLGI